MPTAKLEEAGERGRWWQPVQSFRNEGLVGEMLSTRSGTRAAVPLCALLCATQSGQHTVPRKTAAPGYCPATEEAPQGPETQPPPEAPSRLRNGPWGAVAAAEPGDTWWSGARAAGPRTHWVQNPDGAQPKRERPAEENVCEYHGLGDTVSKRSQPAIRTK